MSTTKPSLLVSTSPSNSRTGSNGGRRIPSWGSAVSDTGSFLSLGAYGDSAMAGLPSPSLSNNGHSAGGWGWGQTGGSSGGDWGGSTGSRGSVGASDDQAELAPREERARSKTLNFFDSPSLGGPTTRGGSGILPPPNPLSRGNSLSSVYNNSPRVSRDAASGSGSWLERLDKDRPPIVRTGSESPDEMGPGQHKSALPTLPVIDTLSPFLPSFASPRVPSPSTTDSPSSGHPKMSPPLLRIQTSSSSNSYTPSTVETPTSVISDDRMSSLPTAFPSRAPPKLPHNSNSPPSSTSSMSRNARFLHFNLPTLNSPSPSPSSSRSQSPFHARYEEGSSPIDRDTPVSPLTPDPARTLFFRAKEAERVGAGTGGVETVSPASTAGSVPSAIKKSAAPVAQAEESLALPPPKEGERIGSFEVVKILGKGAFSRVVLGRRCESKGKEKVVEGEGELVAIKLIGRVSLEDDSRMRISASREIEFLKRMHHPSLVSLSSSFSTPDYTALVLSYCPGGELFDFLADWHQDPGFTEGLARRIFGELCDAVGWMHECGLVHRDIKLENILLISRPFPLPPSTSILSLLPTPFIKLTDFGLSRSINPLSPLLSTRCGSEAYASPELIMGKPYDGRNTDSWACGVVLFALASGGLPFVEEEGGSRKKYLLSIAKGDYRWPGDCKFSGEALRGVVRRLLVRDPIKRARVDEVWSMEWMRGEGRPERARGWVGGREALEGHEEDEGAS